MKTAQKKEKAGGIIIRHDLGEPHVLVIIEGSGAYSFPKGKKKQKETLQETSLRESKEESGIQNLSSGIDLGVHTIRGNDIHFYLYECTNPPVHSTPYEAIRWLSPNEVEKKLGKKKRALITLALQKSRQ